MKFFVCLFISSFCAVSLATTGSMSEVTQQEIGSQTLKDLAKEGALLENSVLCRDAEPKSISLNFYKKTDTKRMTNVKMLQTILDLNGIDSKQTEIKEIVFQGEAIDKMNGYYTFQPRMDLASSECKWAIIGYVSKILLSNSGRTQVYWYLNGVHSGFYIYRSDRKEALLISTQSL